jgi:hypothetical protein
MGTIGIRVNKAKEKEKRFKPLFNLYRSKSFYNDLELLTNEKNKEKFIKSIERIIRTSIEYRNYIGYLRNEVNLAYCTLFDRIPEEVAAALKIEMHHMPFTLYDLVDVVLTKYLTLDRPFTRFSIANEVMDLHFSNKVGLVPLTVTAHQMMHAGKYFIKKSDVFGKYDLFIQENKAYLTDEHLEKITRLTNTSDITIENARKNLTAINPDLYVEYDESDFDQVLLPEIEKMDDEEEINIIDAKKPSNDEGSVDDIEEIEEDDYEEEEEIIPKKSVKLPKSSKKRNKSLSEEIEDDE